MKLSPNFPIQYDSIAGLSFKDVRIKAFLLTVWYIYPAHHVQYDHGSS